MHTPVTLLMAVALAGMASAHPHLAERAEAKLMTDDFKCARPSWNDKSRCIDSNNANPGYKACESLKGSIADKIDAGEILCFAGKSGQIVLGQTDGGCSVTYNKVSGDLDPRVSYKDLYRWVTKAAEGCYDAAGADQVKCEMDSPDDTTFQMTLQYVLPASA